MATTAAKEGGDAAKDVIYKLLNRCTKAQVLDSIDELLRHLNRLIFGNAMSVGVCIFATGVCLITACVILRIMYDTVQTYFKNVREYNSNDAYATQSSSNPDNYTYRTRDTESLPLASEEAMLAGGMQRLRAKYSAYNNALSTYLTNKGVTPDDLIDEGVLTAENDDFEYSKKN
jgi:hypothetical protein